MSKSNINKFQTDGYCIIKNAISVELRDFITQYALFDEHQNFNPDMLQVKNAHSKYADPCMETTLLHLHKTMESNTGLELLPTYSYYRVYRNGDTLETHTDRPSCEISCTLCFNYDYKDTEWPIYMNGNPVYLKPGDLVIYKGCELEHWRNELVYPTPVWHVQGFFHYVNANGPYKDFKYDGRDSVGVSLKDKNNQKNSKTYIEYL